MTEKISGKSEIIHYKNNNMRNFYDRIGSQVSEYVGYLPGRPHLPHLRHIRSEYSFCTELRTEGTTQRAQQTNEYYNIPPRVMWRSKYNNIHFYFAHITN